MQNHDRQNQAAGFSLVAVYDNLLRHKWKIIGLTSAGLLVAALVCFFQQPAAYSSEAKLFIRYVLESRLPGGVYGDPQIKTPDPGGANIINTEIEIMKSMDLAV
jgi:succinoglycan biosynthesis transport protein ExoP